MRIGEAVLRTLSKAPDQNEPADYSKIERSDDPLRILRKEYPDFSSLVNGKKVADFGCGTGLQSIAMAKKEGCRVCGIDTNSHTLTKAKTMAAELGAEDSNPEFVDHSTREMHGTFDIVISQNSMEHFADPMAIVDTMKGLIHKDGQILITFGPLWLAPYGAHMYFFSKVPWINLLFSEQTVMNVRALYRDDGAQRYEEVESGLNRMTLRKFERIIAASGLTIAYRKYSCIKELDWLAKIPLMRELCVNHVSCILTIAK